MLFFYAGSGKIPGTKKEGTGQNGQKKCIFLSKSFDKRKSNEYTIISGYTDEKISKT
jgi:hypothetical protein